MPNDWTDTPAGARWLGRARAPRRTPSPTAERDPAVDRIAAALRAPESAAPDFDSRLLAAVRAAPARGRRAATPPRARVVAPLREAARAEVTPAPWWRRPRTMRVSPAAGLALAAGFAGLVSLATLRASSSGLFGRQTVPVAAAPAAAPDSMQVVRFVLAAPGAARVALVGDFNGWAKDATPLVPAAQAGTWAVSVRVPPGRHEYAFVVDGARWVADPSAPAVLDDHGTETSALVIDAAAPARGA